MAFTRKSDFTFKHINQLDEPVYEDTETLKTNLDSQAVELRTYNNDTLLAELEDTTAAANIGCSGGHVTIQDFIDAVIAAGSGTIPPTNSITDAMMTSDVKIGSLAALTTSVKTSVVAAINSLLSYVNTSIGILSSLNTVEKINLVGAVNEIIGSTVVYGASITGNDTYVVNPTRAITDYTTGMLVIVKVDTSNTGTSTLNISGLGAKNIKKVGNSGKTTLDDYDILGSNIPIFVYDGVDFVLLNPTSRDLISVASNNVVYTSSSTRSANSSSYTKVAEIKVKEAGVYRVKYEHYSPTNTYCNVMARSSSNNIDKYPSGFTSSSSDMYYDNGNWNSETGGIDVTCPVANATIEIFLKYGATNNTISIRNIQLCRDLQSVQPFSTIL